VADTILTITREQRDLLWPEIERWADADEPNLPPLNFEPDVAQRYRRRYEAHFALLDGLGWTRDNDRETFAVTGDRAILEEHLAHESREVRQDLSRHREQLTRLRAGDAEARMVGDTVEESIEYVTGRIERDARLLAVYNNLLAQLKVPASGGESGLWTDMIAIPDELVPELRSGAILDLASPARELSDLAYADERDEDGWNALWDKANDIAELLGLLEDLRDEVFPLSLPHGHRAALAEVARSQANRHEYSIGEASEWKTMNNVRALADTVDALEAFADCVERDFPAPRSGGQRRAAPR